MSDKYQAKSRTVLSEDHLARHEPTSNDSLPQLPVRVRLPVRQSQLAVNDL